MSLKNDHVWFSSSDIARRDTIISVLKAELAENAQLSDDFKKAACAGLDMCEFLESVESMDLILEARVHNAAILRKQAPQKALINGFTTTYVRRVRDHMAATPE